MFDRSDHRYHSAIAAGIGAISLAARVFAAGTAAAGPIPSKVIRHILPDGRYVTPVGRLSLTPNFAIGVVGSGRHLIVEATGAAFRHTLTVFDAHTLARQTQLGFLKKKSWRKDAAGEIPRQSLFEGLAAGSHGMIYAAGGVSGNVLALKCSHGSLQLVRRYPLTFQVFPKSQYPYQYQGRNSGPSHARDFYPDSLAVGRKHIYATGLLSNSVARINLATGRTIYAHVGSMPFAVVMADHGRRLVVSGWGDNGVTVLDPHTMRSIAFIRIGPKTGPRNRLPGVHPTALRADPNSSEVWVACANTDVLAEIDSASLKIVRTIVDEPYRGAPPGSFPDALALHQQLLLAANAGNDDVAVFDARTGKPLGLIPTGWYPTSLTVRRQSLFIVCAKGLGSSANPNGRWIGDSMAGTLQRISLTHLSSHLSAWTRQALRDDGFAAAQRARLALANKKATSFLRRHIRHVVLILRENKTFDEDFGDYRRAGPWADPRLDLYNARELPNLYALAGRFALCVNFYVDGEVTAQGHQWTTAAEDSDYVQRTWPMEYSGRGIAPAPGWTQDLNPPAFHPHTGFAGADDPFSDYQDLRKLKHWSNPWISYPGGMFIFNDLLAHHVSFADFGEFVSRSEAGNISPAMRNHIAGDFPGWNRFILDTHRAGVVARWIHAHAGRLAHFMYIWLPDDHTAGAAPGYYTPDYYVANNDRATGEIVAAISRTRQWRHTLIMITEDDAQSGADHIDAHRSFAVLASPWIRPGELVTRRYSQVDLVRTIEAVCHLPPMSQWDAGARVLGNIWAKKPNVAPFHPRPIRVPVAYNPGNLWRGELQRRRAGKTGNWLSPQWLKAHGAGGAREGLSPRSLYTPTTLLKIPGPEQMRQEWIAAKGRRSYDKVMAYLRRLARKQRQPLSHYIATTDDGDAP